VSKPKQVKVREAVGVFSEAKQLRAAINELLFNGFEPSQLGLLASAIAVRDELGEFYNGTDDNPESDKAPAIAFVNRESIGEIGEAMKGSLYFVGSSALVGAIVASSAVLGGALIAAVGGILGVGLVGLVATSMINQSDAEELQQRVDEGHILLFLRLPPRARVQKAIDILSRHSTTDVKVYKVAVNSDEHESEVEARSQCAGLGDTN
jgi:hypothetical protein